jgi:putative ABC transport system permease protein
MGIRNALRRKGRSFSTVLQVAFAVGVVIAVLNMGDAIIAVTEDVYEDRTWDLWLFVGENPADPMTTDKASLVEDIDGVESAEPFVRSNVEINDRAVAAMGLVHDTESLAYERTLLELGQGRWWTADEAEDAERVAVVGDALAKYEEIELGDTIELMTATGAHDFEVIGIEVAFVENGQFVTVPIETFQDVLQKDDGVTGFFLQTDTADHSEIDRASVRVQDDLEDLGYRGDVSVNYVMAEQNIEQNRGLSGMFLAVGFIVVLIVLIGLMSTLVMNILDRTTEIGMLRCIGAKSKDVRRVFSSEALFLAFIGWIIGVPLGFGVFMILYAAMSNAMKLAPPFGFDALYVGLALVFAMLGTLVVIFFPLRRATRMRPGDAIRYE